MKTLQWIGATFLLLGIAQFGLAQGKTRTIAIHSSGLYLSFEDFRQGKLTYPMDCENSDDKIKLNDWFGSSRGFIWSNGEKHEFDKTRVYGYRDCKKTLHRFYQGEVYKILDTSGFYLYYKYGQQEVTRGKGLVKTDEFYFSTRGGGVIQLLTGENLKMAFRGNSRFRYSLDAGFRSDRDLIAYDDVQQTYKIKYLYGQSLK